MVDTGLAAQRALRQSVLIFDYPGYGKSSGKPSEQGCYAAAEASYHWLTTVLQMPAERIVLYGESLGGGVATELAVRSPHRALVLVRTFTCVPDLARKSVWSSSLALCAQPIRQPGAHRELPGPGVHRPWRQGCRDSPGTRHQIVGGGPSTQAWLAVDNCGHNDDLPPEFFQALAEFLENSCPLPSSTR